MPLMPQIFRYTNQTLPDHIKWQVLDFLRIVWTDGFEGENQFRDWITHERLKPVYFDLIEEKMLISHAGILHRELEHNAKTYIIASFSGVFTYPQFRKRGHGLYVITEARKYMESLNPDFIFFTTTVEGFYEKAGFTCNPEAKVSFGNKENPEISDEQVYLCLVSEKVKESENAFKTMPIYVGESMW